MLFFVFRRLRDKVERKSGHGRDWDRSTESQSDGRKGNSRNKETEIDPESWRGSEKRYFWLWEMADGQIGRGKVRRTRGRARRGRKKKEEADRLRRVFSPHLLLKTLFSNYCYYLSSSLPFLSSSPSRLRLFVSQRFFYFFIFYYQWNVSVDFESIRCLCPSNDERVGNFKSNMDFI